MAGLAVGSQFARKSLPGLGRVLPNIVVCDRGPTILFRFDSIDLYESRLWVHSSHLVMAKFQAGTGQSKCFSACLQTLNY